MSIISIRSNGESIFKLKVFKFRKLLFQLSERIKITKSIIFKYKFEITVNFSEDISGV